MRLWREALLDNLFTPTHAIICLPFFLIWAGIYVLPTLIAAYRNHHSRTPIIWINVLLGWSVIGWIVALVWAFTAPAPVPRAS